jgi:hypothetical protein
MHIKVGSEDRRYKYARFQGVITFIFILFCAFTLIVVLLTPIFAWFKSDLTQLDTNYWTLRYLLMLFYIVINGLTALLPHIHNFAFLVTDGILLS